MIGDKESKNKQNNQGIYKKLTKQSRNIQKLTFHAWEWMETIV